MGDCTGRFIAGVPFVAKPFSLISRGARNHVGREKENAQLRRQQHKGTFDFIVNVFPIEREKTPREIIGTVLFLFSLITSYYFVI